MFISCATYERIPPKPRVTLSPLFSKQIYDRIGIYVNDNTRKIKKGGIRIVDDEFSRAALERGYTLASRSDIEKILKEINFQHSNISESAIARKAKILNVSGILIVDINRFKKEFVPAIYPTREYRGYYKINAAISARLISSEIGEVVWISSYEGYLRVNRNSDGTETLSAFAYVVASGLPDQ